MSSQIDKLEDRMDSALMKMIDRIEETGETAECNFMVAEPCDGEAAYIRAESPAAKQPNSFLEEELKEVIWLNNLEK